MQCFYFDFPSPPKISIYLFHLLSQILSCCPSPIKPPSNLSKVNHVEASARRAKRNRERGEGKKERERGGGKGQEADKEGRGAGKRERGKEGREGGRREGRACGQRERGRDSQGRGAREEGRAERADRHDWVKGSRAGPEG